ncbi:hypothetical protein HQ884_04475 [Enterococcus faecium]|uniref:hypothetical protein n=1 Tax=Enterococcus faecium TaxID=1352 RepID=UPI0001B6E980|nr:hypothetical protein [Enterococcus faecium]EEV49821.1 predicted protein [Enterococcus faecium 1,141,733]EGP4937200.1 hypothetical protein [Enterococcus faecium]EGP4956770.1 hypothetical protein [Enterococcus faecium]EGP5051817.1 hypothetical protein [Enterococcus faecium]EGP5195943.1 hypothetical protein [Enterococcus faecium]
MTVKDEEYRYISEHVYWIDPKHPQYSKTYKEGGIKKIGNTKFQILKIKDSLDGMQAMAVAPIVHSKLEKNFKNKKIPANFRVLK